LLLQATQIPSDILARQHRCSVKHSCPTIIIHPLMSPPQARNEFQRLDPPAHILRDAVDFVAEYIAPSPAVRLSDCAKKI